jgi:hypothetical protein
MRAHYSELFAGLNVLLFTNGDPQAEANMFAASAGAPPSVARLFRWDIRVPMGGGVDTGNTEIYEFFRTARSSLWRNYLAGASRKEIAFVMRVFIRARERHINLRIDRGELKLQTWTRRAPRLNQEFIDIFDEEYLKLKAEERTGAP